MPPLVLAAIGGVFERHPYELRNSLYALGFAAELQPSHGEEEVIDLPHEADLPSMELAGVAAHVTPLVVHILSSQKTLNSCNVYV